MELIIRLFPGFAKLTLFTLILTLGLGWTFADVAWLWRRPGLLFRSLLSVLVLVPIGAALVVKGWIPPGPIAIGIGAMAASPGAPLLPRKAAKAGGHASFIASLQITLALVAIVTVPITVTILSALYPADAVVSAKDIARQVATVQLLPLGIGILIRHFWSDLAETLEEHLGKIANAMFMVLAILLLATQLDQILNAEIRALVAIVLINIFALACGHFLGGTDMAIRSELAFASATRNAGLAVFLVTFNFSNNPDVKVAILNTVIVYALVSAFVTIPYSVWCKKLVRQRELAAAPSSEG